LHTKRAIPLHPRFFSPGNAKMSENRYIPMVREFLGDKPAIESTGFLD